MADERTVRTFRITYRREGGTLRYYFTAEENASFAVTDFLLRTGNVRESIVSVEIAWGHSWIPAL